MDTYTEPQNIYQKYTAISGSITGWLAEQLDMLVEDYGEINVQLALDTAAEKRISSLNYIKGILHNMKERGELVIIRSGHDYAAWND